MILVVEPDGKEPLGRPKSRWVDSIKMYVKEIGREDVNCFGLAQDRDKWRGVVSRVTKFHPDDWLGNH